MWTHLEARHPHEHNKAKEEQKLGEINKKKLLEESKRKSQIYTLESAGFTSSASTSTMSSVSGSKMSESGSASASCSIESSKFISLSPDCRQSV